jgi:hypothetical protein
VKDRTSLLSHIRRVGETQHLIMEQLYKLEDRIAALELKGGDAAP